MATLSLRLPHSLHRHLKELAEKEKVSINQLISTAVAEKMSALMTVDYLEGLARGGSREPFGRARQSSRCGVRPLGPLGRGQERLTLMDKKALKREYKETARPMGVYQIRNTVNGKVLLGTSTDPAVDPQPPAGGAGCRPASESRAAEGFEGAGGGRVRGGDPRHAAPCQACPATIRRTTSRRSRGCGSRSLSRCGEKGYHAAPKA